MLRCDLHWSIYHMSYLRDVTGGLTLKPGDHWQLGTSQHGHHSVDGDGLAP